MSGPIQRNRSYPPATDKASQNNKHGGSAPSSPVSSRKNLFGGGYEGGLNGGGSQKIDEHYDLFRGGCEGINVGAPQNIDEKYGLDLFSARLKKENVKFNDFNHQILQLDSGGTLEAKSENFIFRVKNKFSQWFLGTESFTQHNLEVSFITGLKALYLHPNTKPEDCEMVKSDLNSFKTAFEKDLKKDEFADKLHSHLLLRLEEHKPSNSTVEEIPSAVDISNNKLLKHILKDVFKGKPVAEISFYNIEVCLNKCKNYLEKNKNLNLDELENVSTILSELENNFKVYLGSPIGEMAKGLHDSLIDLLRDHSKKFVEKNVGVDGVCKLLLNTDLNTIESKSLELYLRCFQLFLSDKSNEISSSDLVKIRDKLKNIHNFGGGVLKDVINIIVAVNQPLFLKNDDKTKYCKVTYPTFLTVS